MQGIILAAGKGTRLKDLTIDTPKALIPVLGKPLLQYCLDFFDKDIIDKVIVVTGFKSKAVEDFINTLPSKNKNIAVVNNPHYELGNIVSLKAALPRITDSFLVMNVDHIYYHPQIFGRITADTSGITAVCDFDRVLGEDDMKILVDNKLRLVKMSKTLTHYSGGYTGMTICHKRLLNVYKKAVETIYEQYSGNIHVEHVLQYLCDHNVEVKICDISGLGWVEIDTEKDLQKATEILSKFIALRKPYSKTII